MTVGMAVLDKNPIVRWEQGQGDIGAVRIVVPLNFRHLTSFSKSGLPDLNA